MAIKKRSLKNSLKAKDLTYSNDFFNFKHETIITSDSFTYNTYNALKDVSDAKTNNYSNLFLTKKQLNSNWLELNEKRTDNFNPVTTLSFYASDNSDKTNPGVWLYFDKTYEFWDVYLKSAPYALTYGRPTDNLYNYFFYLQFINDTECKISHNFGDLIFYLGINNDLKIQFYVDDNPDYTVFNYTYDNNRLQLFKPIKSEDGSIIVYQLICTKLDDDSYALDLVQSVEDSAAATIFVNDNLLQMDVYLDNSFISYDQSQYITAINRSKSAFHLPSQAIIHHQYNKDSGVNFVPLKNNTNYKGGHGRGNNLSISTENYPDVNYRSYNAIHSGINQEYGNDNIILNYHFTDQIYNISDGETFQFDIPTVEENNGKQPLWPYKSLNIADTKFIKNGAFASNVPFFADKISKLQGPNTIIINEKGEKLSPNNGTYLCTWLYQNNDKSECWWLDRYYYPDKISRAETLLSPHYEQSFENILDKNYNTPDVTKLIRENTYFDKISDLVLEPGNSYKYHRISTEMVNDINNELEEYLIKDVENQFGELAYLSDKLSFDNKNWLRIDHSSFNKTNQINLNTDIYITPEKRIGIQLFGTDYKSGFNIQNRKDLAPFHYYATDKKIFMLNNNFEIKHEFDLYGKYNDIIVKFILGDSFDDIVVISNLYIYIFAYDLRLKTRIEYSDILDLPGLELEGLDGELLGFPYSKESLAIINFNKGEIVDTEYISEKTLVDVDIRFDSFTKINLDDFSLDVFFTSNIARIFANANAIIYHSNLYIPYNQNIVKIIFIPESDYDNFTQEEMDEYACKARLLKPSEYHLSFNRGDTDTNEPGIENGFIEVENKIKNLYFDNNGKLFAFNFDKMAMSSDGDTMYGLYGWDRYINAGGWYWLYDQSLSKIQAVVTSSKFTEFGSTESIDWIRTNERGEFIIIRGFHNYQNDVDNETKRFEVYDKTKKIIHHYSLKDFDEIYSVDAYNYIDEENEEHSVFTILALQNESIYKIEYMAETGVTRVSLTKLPIDKNSRFYETTNSNAIIRYANENKLYFNLYLPAGNLYDYCETIEWDLKESQQGWYNINVHIDLDAAEFVVKINDIEFDKRAKTKAFIPYVFSNGTIFDTTYYIGNVGKKYGTTLDRILSYSAVDPYVCKNSKIENMRIHTKTLDYYEYQAMRLHNKNINTIALTLPCGQRSNIEEIVRYFKYTPPNAISNKVKINISGTGLSTRGEFELLEKEIREVLKNDKDCLVDVEQIEFI